MKKAILSQLFVLAMAIGLSLYPQETPNKSATEQGILSNITTGTSNWWYGINESAEIKERKRRAKKLVDQARKDGKTARDIYNFVLLPLIEQSPERKIEKHILDQYDTARSKLKECERQEILRKLADDKEWEKAHNQLQQGLQKCTWTKCQSLQQEVDKLEQEYSNARDAIWKTPEGMLCKKIDKIASRYVYLRDEDLFGD